MPKKPEYDQGIPKIIEPCTEPNMDQGENKNEQDNIEFDKIVDISAIWFYHSLKYPLIIDHII